MEGHDMNIWSCISLLVAMIFCTSATYGAEAISDDQLSSSSGADIWGCDADCLDVTGGCPAEVSHWHGCQGCQNDLDDCTGSCKTTANQQCGNWQWQIIGIQCTPGTAACESQLSTYTGWCVFGSCLVQGGHQQDAPACSTCTRTDC